MRKKNKRELSPVTFDEKKLREDLLHSAKAIGISIGVAEIIVGKISQKVAERLTKRAAVTTDDLHRFVAEEAEKYNKDLAYVYKNRGKII